MNKFLKILYTSLLFFFIVSCSDNNDSIDVMIKNHSKMNHTGSLYVVDEKLGNDILIEPENEINISFNMFEVNSLINQQGFSTGDVSFKLNNQKQEKYYICGYIDGDVTSMCAANNFTLTINEDMTYDVTN